MVLPGATAMAASCDALTGAKSGPSVVTAAEVVPVGAALPVSHGAQAQAATVDFCRVRITSRPTADSDIRIELWVPAGKAWNGKFEQVGNGGFAGVVPYWLMARVLAAGYAVAGTDDGHQSDDNTDASWALNHPEKVKDFGWRAIRETSVASKAFLRRLTRKAPAKSYFVGCSDGGREALMMAQRYPTAFDGILAGAPAYAMTRLLTRGALLYGDLGGSVSRFSTAQLELLQQQALKRCGNGQGYLKDPRQCSVDPGAERCVAGGAATCLSDAQVRAAQVLYADRKGLQPGETLYGVKPGAEAVPGSWDAWLTGTEDGSPVAGTAFTWNYLAYMVMKDPKLQWSQVRTADIARGQQQYSPILDSDSADLSAFKAHGGKLIIYHGWNDPGIAPDYSVEYRDRVRAATAGADSFLRLYMVPGMLHCAGGAAPTSVNWQAALEAWVENAKPPGELTASDGKGNTQTILPF